MTQTNKDAHEALKLIDGFDECDSNTVEGYCFDLILIIKLNIRKTLQAIIDTDKRPTRFTILTVIPTTPTLTL